MSSACPVHRPHDGLYRVRSDGLQLRKHGAHIVWRVLRVDTSQSKPTPAKSSAMEGSTMPTHSPI